VELQQIVERYAEAIQHVDATTQAVGQNRRTGSAYLPGFKTLDEEPAMRAIDDAWEHLHPGERRVHRLSVKYPTTAVPATTKLDHVLTTDGAGKAEEEWGIEVKRLQFVGDNGGNGDHETQKVLSPYLKDRGLLHDALRLREYGFTRRVAVVAWSFDYDATTLAHARYLHTAPDAVARIDRIQRLVDRNGPLHTRPLIEFADAILGLRSFLKGPRAQAGFDAWRHPAGGKGVVFGWEIRRPDREPGYDPRHPW